MTHPRTAVVAISIASFLCSTGLSSAASCDSSWQRDLKVGSTGKDVQSLQQFLNQSADTQIAATGAGSPGAETTLFGSLSKKAVIAFQNKYSAEILVPNGLTTGSGIVGPSTRAKLNALCAAPVASAAPITASTTAPTIASPLLIIGSAEQPAATLAPAYALYVPFTSFTLTAQGGNVTVNSVTVERVGPSSDQAFYDLDLFEDGEYVSVGYLTNDHRVVFKDPVTIGAGESHTFDIVGDMNDTAGHAGEMAGIQVIAIDASVPVAGILPLRGTYQTINDSLLIGEAFATLSQEDPQVDRTRYINDTGITFSGVRVQAGSQEDIKINSITWEQNGSAGASDLDHVTTLVNGVSYPTEVDGRHYTSTFPNGLLVTKGNSIDLVVRGDITTTGSNRTVKFDLHYGTDIDIIGQTYSYGIALVASDHTDVTGNSVFLTSDGTGDGTSMTPFFSGSLVTVQNAGLISIGR